MKEEGERREGNHFQFRQAFCHIVSDRLRCGNGTTGRLRLRLEVVKLT